jgi:hypothetical protein
MHYLKEGYGSIPDDGFGFKRRPLELLVITDLPSYELSVFNRQLIEDRLEESAKCKIG